MVKFGKSHRAREFAQKINAEVIFIYPGKVELADARSIKLKE